jgi:hypothetical protein
MAAYKSVGDGYEWHINLPPPAVTAMLESVCVNRSAEGGKRYSMGHLLWGPKSWAIQIEGLKFCISPLWRSVAFNVFAPHLGTISEAKPGSSRVQLEFSSTRTQRDRLRLVLGASAAVFGGFVAVVLSFSAGLGLWGVPIALAVATWFFCGFYWMVPSTMQHEPLNFLNEVFADRVLP